MTLVLLVAITTATFAWYQASKGLGTVTGSGDSGQLTTAAATVSGETNLNVTISIAPVDNNSTAVLSHYNEGWVTKYYNTATASPVVVGLGSNQVYAKAYSISISIADDQVPAGYTKADAAKLIRDAGVKINLSVADNLVDADTQNSISAVTNGMKSRTHVWGSATTLSDATATSSAAPTSTVEFDGAALTNWAGGSTVIGYFLFYIDGEGATNNNDGAFAAGTNELKTRILVAVSKK